MTRCSVACGAIRALALLSVLVLSGCGEEREPFEAADRAAIPERLRQSRPGARAVTMEPAGTWHVTQPPRRVVAYQAIEAEMALALGRGADLVGMFDRQNLATLQRLYYDQLHGVRVPLGDIAEIPFAEQMDREIFYQLDPDVFLIDPRLPLVSWGWGADDVKEIANRVAPFFGNFIRYPRDGSWGPAYPRYSLDESFAIHAQLFGRQQRYRRFAEFRDKAISRIRDRLPPPEQRPRICLINIGSKPEKGQFYLVNISEGGARVRQYGDLGLEQSFDPKDHATGSFGECDYETLAEIDPPVIIVHWATTKCADAEEFRQRYVEPMRNHPVGQRLRAVQEGMVLPGGTGEQGPITHLFQLEMVAQQLFPDRFGRWRWGQIPEDPQFDRERLAAIIRGEEGP